MRERLNWALVCLVVGTGGHWRRQGDTGPSPAMIRTGFIVSLKVEKRKTGKLKIWKERRDIETEKETDGKIKASLSPVCSSFVRRRCGCFTYKNYLGTPQITYTRTHRMYYNQPLQRQGKKRGLVEEGDGLDRAANKPIPLEESFMLRGRG